MAKEYVIVDKADLEIIANSAREKTSTTDKYSVAALAEAMASTIVPPLPADSPGNKQLVTNSIGMTKWIDQYCSKEESFTTLLEEQTLDFSTDQSSVITFEIEGGKKYTVTVDGTDYIVTALDREAIGEIVIPARIIISDIGLVINQYSFAFDDNGIHTVKIIASNITFKTLDEDYIPNLNWNKIYGKPAISGGVNNAIREGSNTQAFGDAAHAEGIKTQAFGEAAHAEGIETKANGHYSHAEGSGTGTNGSCSHAEGANTYAYGECSHTEGCGTTATAAYAHAEGYQTSAKSENQHVEGKYNIQDADSVYVHIVGNGSSSMDYSNAHTLDWDGNAWYAGTVEGTAMIVKSSTANSTKRFKITVDDSGTISATEITT